MAAPTEHDDLWKSLNLDLTSTESIPSEIKKTLETCYSDLKGQIEELKIKHEHLQINTGKPCNCIL